MFAFCLWDKKLKEFLLVRDRFGEKPLFYYLDNKNFVFGSEIKIITEFFKPKKLELIMIRLIFFFFRLYSCTKNNL